MVMSAASAPQPATVDSERLSNQRRGTVVVEEGEDGENAPAEYLWDKENARKQWLEFGVGISLQKDVFNGLRE